jgi:hypothetical protein
MSSDLLLTKMGVAQSERVSQPLSLQSSPPDTEKFSRLPEKRKGGGEGRELQSPVQTTELSQ